MKFKIFFSICLLGFNANLWAAEITIAAASSLTDAFKVLSRNFEKQYPNTKINLTFASSGTLLQQLRHGAPIDILATADIETMDDAASAQLIQKSTRTNFTSNQLVLIASSQKKLKVSSLKDLRQANIQHIAIGEPLYTPAGRYAKAAMMKDRIWDEVQPKIVKTQNVRQALSYVRMGETDVGFVFSSDIYKNNNQVYKLLNVVTTPIVYPIAVSTTSKNLKQAQDFIRYVKSNEGQQILSEYGFQK